jgi:aspartokinase-like uncharacterized kinase
MKAAVVRVGGSLSLYPEKLRALCANLCEASNRHKLLVLPGGSEFADVIRDFDQRFNLSAEAAHKMAILGMDQYGYLLSDLMSCSHLLNKLEDAKKLLDQGKLSVFLPSNFLCNELSLENSWDVTSDSIAIYIAGKLHAEKAVLVTDVDGVYTSDPKKFRDAKLIEKISATELFAMNMRTSVDKFLPKLLLQLKIECYVVNGLYPERVMAVLEGKQAICTLIYS